MTNLNGDLNISLGKKSHKTNFLSPQEWKKNVLREILTSFTLICLVNRSTIAKKEKWYQPNMLLGVKTKRGEFFMLWELKSYLLFCGVKNLQLLPSTRLWQHSSRFRAVGHTQRVIARALQISESIAYLARIISLLPPTIFICVFCSR